jgi:hypothetical protein
MNDRIKELAREAADGMLSYDAEGEFRLNQQEVFKFAELIIQESITRITRMGILNNCEEQSKMACDELKEHFGIK